jgi:hypothetical protein
VIVLPMSDRSAYLRRYGEPDKARSSSATPGPVADAMPEAVASDDRASKDLAQQWPVPYWDLDTAMASIIALLAAVDAGLGGWFFGIGTGDD